MHGRCIWGFTMEVDEEEEEGEEEQEAAPAGNPVKKTPVQWSVRRRTRSSCKPTRHTATPQIKAPEENSKQHAPHRGDQPLPTTNVSYLFLPHVLNPGDTTRGTDHRDSGSEGKLRENTWCLAMLKSTHRICSLHYTCYELNLPTLQMILSLIWIIFDSCSPSSDFFLYMCEIFWLACPALPIP